jgi:NAD(P)-dependent dehydrogenase (short-subunit alcohol dehydrogenase family)
MIETKTKRALITGGTGLIGRALIKRFEQTGWHVIAPTRAQFDLAVPGQAERMVAAAGDIDLLINCAADQSVLELSSDPTAIARLFQINVLSPLAALVKAKQYGASVGINISSIEAISPRMGHEIYGASKAALEGLTKSLAVSLAPMRVNAIRLGLIGDATLEERWPDGVASWRNSVPAGRYGAPEEVAEFALTIAGGQFDFATGAIFDFDGGKSASPGW